MSKGEIIEFDKDDLEFNPDTRFRKRASREGSYTFSENLVYNDQKPQFET